MPRKTSAPTLDQIIDVDFTVDDELIKVDARNAYRPIHGYTDNGELMEIGRVKHTDYADGRSVRALTLESTLTGKEHSLGTASVNFRTHSHAQIVRPFTRMGFEVRSAVYNDTGSQAITTLAHPDRSLADFIGIWDAQWLGDKAQDVAGNSVQLAVRVRSDLRSGYGARADMGFFRLVCLNGLVSSVLEMGSWRANHSNWKADNAVEFAGQMLALHDGAPQLGTAPTELLGDVIELLDRLEAETDVIARLPRLLRQPATMIARESAGGRGEALRENLLALKEGKSTMTKIDLLNAQTNVAHAARSRWSVYNQTDTVVSSLVDLVDLAGVKHGVPTFELN